jgi:hypothetical protein
MAQAQIQAFLKSRNAQYSNETEDSWLIEGAGNQCKLWFDEKANLSRKRKILTTE